MGRTGTPLVVLPVIVVVVVPLPASEPMSLDPGRTRAVYPVVAWPEIAGRRDGVGDGAPAADIRQAMNGRRPPLGAPF